MMALPDMIPKYTKHAKKNRRCSGVTLLVAWSWEKPQHPVAESQRCGRAPFPSRGWMTYSINGGTPIAGWLISWKIPSIDGWLGVPLWLRKPQYLSYRRNTMNYGYQPLSETPKLTLAARSEVRYIFFLWSSWRSLGNMGNMGGG
jgi:hypothetical protein